MGYELSNGKDAKVNEAQVMATKPQEKTVGDVLRIVFSHYKLFFAGVAGFVIVTMIISLHIPVKYTTTTTFERQTDSAADKVGVNKTESFNLIKLTLEDELCGLGAIEKVADSLGLFKKLERGSDGKLTPNGELKKQKILREIKTGLLVSKKVSTPVLDQIELSFTYTDPHLAVEIPNRLVDYYMNNVNGRIITELKESSNFLKKQIDEGNARLAELTKKKIEFESRCQDVNLEDSNGLQERVNEMQADLECLYRELAVAGRKTQQLKTRLANSRNSMLKTKLQELEDKREENLTLKQMTDAHPEVQKLNERIAQLRQQLQADASEGNATFNEYEPTAYESGLMVQLISAQGDEEAVRSEISRMEQRIKNNTEMQAKIIPLREEYTQIIKPIERQQDEVNRWNGVLTEVSMTLASEEANRRTQLKTVQPAQKPDTPQFPPFLTILGIALGGGLVCGYFLAFLGDAADHTIHDPKDAAEKFASFDVPVVGVINEIMTPKTRTIKRLRHFTLTLVVIALISTMCVSTYCLMWRLHNPDSNKAWKNAIPTAAVNPTELDIPVLAVQ
jgi:uncharacterized protein involved in exopolysaccharide biosynthesis